jgi:IS30 family transposase
MASNDESPRTPGAAMRSKSTVGRPRRLTDRDIEAILDWHRHRKTLTQIAREHGVSKTTILNAIARRGEYKQPSPEERAATQRARRLRRMKLEESGLL